VKNANQSFIAKSRSIGFRRRQWDSYLIENALSCYEVGFGSPFALRMHPVGKSKCLWAIQKDEGFQ
jgi:hypothetical protein